MKGALISSKDHGPTITLPGKKILRLPQNVKKKKKKENPSGTPSATLSAALSGASQVFRGNDLIFADYTG